MLFSTAADVPHEWPSGPAASPLRIGVVGLTHTHVHWILGREDRGDIVIVGISESDSVLARKYVEQHGLDMSLVYPSMEAMIEATQPEAVTAFNDTYHHLDVVRYCAPRGIHVMVEKPLAVSVAHAEEMVALATQHNIHLLTNYETSWYPSTMEAYRLVHAERAIGDIRKMVFYTGHQGPVEIGCNEEFLAWLTDPVLNGGGVLMDFGCYGANLATWFMHGKIPAEISAETQQIKPHIYPEVEDEATILVTYPDAQAVIMASWNWPFNRKEMEIYGTDGYIKCTNGTDMEILRDGAVSRIKAPHDDPSLADPFAYFHGVVKLGREVEPWSLSAADNNLRVMHILESAKTNR